MRQYKVEITKEALQDMEDIYNYVAIDLLALYFEMRDIKARVYLKLTKEIRWTNERTCRR